MQQLLTIFLLCIVSVYGNAQYTLLGTVRGENDQTLPGASVYKADSYLGTTTNASGVYKLELDSGTHVIIVDFIGYKEILDTINISENTSLDFKLKSVPFMGDEFVLESTRADEAKPFSYQNVSKDEIEDVNLGQDLPILLNQTVSAVTTSDAGTGIGYTGIRIRGSDATRINVTVNGVPLNDAESHGVFWVNMPDFASTTNSIQIQRGVGTSTNGAAAFGASINLQTTGFDSVAYVELNNGYGMFNTRRHNAVFNSGIVSKHFNFEGRLSYISSDGFIDRSASDLRSYYVAGGYYRKKLLVKAVTFSGSETTQQAWYGTPESRLFGSDEDMLNHAANNGYSPNQIENLLTSGRTFNFYTYDNEVDQYKQDHYQLITGYQILPNLYLNITGHYTRGKGYFEQYKYAVDYADINFEYPVVNTDTVKSSDMIFRRWLDNHFYGGVYSLRYDFQNMDITIGGSYNEYVGDHFGEVIWAQIANNSSIRDRYYSSNSKKQDASNYIKAQYRFRSWNFYADVQYRYIEYTSKGVDNDQRPIRINRNYNFINPKIGASLRANAKNNLYFSIAQASREPVRGDFTDAVPGTLPKPEFLTNAELGWQFASNFVKLNSTAYLMYYQDQLVLTGEVNDVGSPIRTNVDQSYRAGIELAANIDLIDGLYLQPNATISQNKIIEFNELTYDYTTGIEIVTTKHENTDIAFSPWLVSGAQLGYRTEWGLHAALMTKYVSEQYLDNTSNDDRAIDGYFTTDVLLSQNVSSKHWKELELSVLVRNVLNTAYESNGYTYSYIYGDLITENFYYPQAGIQWMVGLRWKF